MSRISRLALPVAFAATIIFAVWQLGQSQEARSRSIQRWEYSVEVNLSGKQLGISGDDGWELVTVIHDAGGKTYYWKRPK